MRRGRVMNAFLKDARGNVAVLLALVSLPMMGLAGAAVDYSRANSVKESLRKFSDKVALSVASSEDPTTSTKFLAGAEYSLRGVVSHDIENIKIDGYWLDNANYKVSISADVPVTILSRIPGLPKYISTGAVTIANRSAPRFQTVLPAMAMLDPEAGDYNRLYMYCFNPARVGDEDKGRGEPVPFADNASTTHFDVELPQCEAGEYVGYMLRNVRSARAHPSRWDDPSQEVYEYYTDSFLNPVTHVLHHQMKGYRIHDGTRREEIDMSHSGILETVLCRNKLECRPRREGGVIPDHQRGREPLTATEPCEQGMYMYFGWEDRPVHPQGHPHRGWSDEDYDDIRLIVSCPKVTADQMKQVRIVR